MNARRRTARILTALAAVGVLLAPSTQALADDSEPEPTAWPTVDAAGSTSDQASEPEPVKWPAPVENPG
ncbi:hypothetical protein [Kribbella sp. NPDC048928]|uniref:hypothetical protein n=1 Tax=Kribbella sp. NPDC048928 TaxID=3364111 RepID=UPI003723C21A